MKRAVWEGMPVPAVVEMKGAVVRPGGEDTPPVLKGCSFSVQPGEKVVIVGESGAGKTTLLRAVAGLLPLEAGTLRAPENPGWLPQHPLASFDPRWSVMRSVCEPLILAGKTKAEARKEAGKVLESLLLSRTQYDLRPLALSGGQLRRAAIARALTASSRLVLADEPTAGLDPETALGLIDLFREITKKRKTALVWVTHDLGVASAVSDRVLVLSGGKIVEAAQMGRLASNPRTEMTRKLLGAWLPLDADAARKQLTKPGSVAPNIAAWIREEIEEEEKEKEED